jgi:hypothetical protein
MNLISFTAPDLDPPPIIPRVPRPVLDPVPPPRFGLINSN